MVFGSNACAWVTLRFDHKIRESRAQDLGTLQAEFSRLLKKVGENPDEHQVDAKILFPACTSTKIPMAETLLRAAR